MYGENCESYGLYAGSDIKISSCAMTATGKPAGGEFGKSYGIYTNALLNITSGIISANAGTGVVSCGVYGSEIKISSGSLSATADIAFNSYGVYANNILINGGNLNAKGEFGSTESYGVCATEVLRIQSGLVRAVGQTSALSKSPDLADYLLARTITASENINGTPHETYNAADNDIYKYFRIIPDIYVGGTQVKDNNYYLNDGANGINLGGTSDNYNVSYIDGVLTLKDARIDKSYTFDFINAAVYAESDLIINVIEDSMLYSVDYVNNSYGIYVNGSRNLTITGSKCLVINGGASSEITCGIKSSNVTIEGGEIYANGTNTTAASGVSYGVNCDRLTVKGGIFNASSEDVAVDCPTVIIEGGEVTASVRECDTKGQGWGIYCNFFTMKDGSLTVNSTDRTGVDCQSFGVVGITMTIEGGKVTVNSGNTTGEYSRSYGFSGNNLIIKGGDVTVNAGNATGTNSQSYGVHSATVITGGSLTATGDMAALSKIPELSEYPVPRTIAASTNINGTQSTEYIAADNASYKYFTIIPGVLTIAGKPMKSGDYYVNGENGAAGEVYDTEPLSWNAKLELIEGKYTLTLNGLEIDKNYTSYSGIVSYVDLNLHVATDTENIICTYGQGSCLDINGDLVISEQEGIEADIDCRSYAQNIINVTGTLTISDGSIELNVNYEGTSDGNVNVFNVGEDLIIGKGADIYANVTTSNIDCRGIKAAGNVVMNGENLKCSVANGIGLEAAGSITISSGKINLSGSSGALNKQPIIAGYPAGYFWQANNSEDLITTPYVYDDEHIILGIMSMPTVQIADVSVSGTVNNEITSSQTTITLIGMNVFVAEMPADKDITDWFTNIPDGISAKLNGAVEVYDQVASVTFSGTPTEFSDEDITILIPKDVLYIGFDAVSEENENAKWSIASNITSVSVSPKTVEVLKGGTQTFTATVTGTNNPDETVTWSVEGGIATTTIDEDGLLTIAATETATSLTITATSTFDDTKSGTATVTVTVPAVTSVSVSPETVIVAKGGSQQFTAEVIGTDNPDLTVTWSVTGGIPTTTIALNGRLSIAADETATSLTVRATSTYDDTKYDEATVTVVTKYPIIKGANGKWIIKTESDLGFTADADYDKFESVEVDGELLSSSDYTTAEGSTIVTLNNAYLKTLAVGAHTLRINFTDGYSETTFNIASNNPTTGEANDYLLLTCIMLIAGLGISLSYIVRKRRVNG